MIYMIILCLSIQKSVQLGREYTNIRYTNEVLSPLSTTNDCGERPVNLTLSHSALSLPATALNLPSSPREKTNKSPTDVFFPRFVFEYKLMVFLRIRVYFDIIFVDLQTFRSKFTKICRRKNVNFRRWVITLVLLLFSRHHRLRRRGKLEFLNPLFRVILMFLFIYF